MCQVKHHDRGILKIKGLGRGDSRVWPLILGIYPTHSGTLPVVKHKAKFITNQTYASHEA